MGGSSDQTAEIIRKYETWLSYWVSEPDRGQSDDINKGFKEHLATVVLGCGEGFLEPACFVTRDAWEFDGPFSQVLHHCMDPALWIEIAERFRFESLPELIAYAFSCQNGPRMAVCQG